MLVHCCTLRRLLLEPVHRSIISIVLPWHGNLPQWSLKENLSLVWKSQLLVLLHLWTSPLAPLFYFLPCRKVCHYAHSGTFKSKPWMNTMFKCLGSMIHGSPIMMTYSGLIYFPDCWLLSLWDHLYQKFNLPTRKEPQPLPFSLTLYTSFKIHQNFLQKVSLLRNFICLLCSPFIPIFVLKVFLA